MRTGRSRATQCWPSEESNDDAKTGGRVPPGGPFNRLLSAIIHSSSGRNGVRSKKTTRAKAMETMFAHPFVHEYQMLIGVFALFDG